MIRLLAVDDSALMRRLIGEVFADEPDIEVSVARSGAEALARLQDARPDVVTLDINMPGMDGLSCLDRIMVERPCPVVMVSSLTAEGARETLEALALGAVDFMPKPAGALSLKLDDFGPALIAKVRGAARARVARSHRLAERVRLKRAAAPLSGPRTTVARRQPAHDLSGLTGPGAQGLVLVGSSTGGPPALDAVLAGLPADFPWPIVVAQHMPAAFTGPLAARLDRLCSLEVVEVSRPVRLAPGRVFIARGDADVLISRRGGDLTVLSAPANPGFRWRPSVDRLVDSALATAPAAQLVGVLLTGMGDDGAAAMTRLREAGGRTIAESEETAVVWGMPGALVRAGGADAILPVDQIDAGLMALARRS